MEFVKPFPAHRTANMVSIGASLDHAISTHSQLSLSRPLWVRTSGSEPSSLLPGQGPEGSLVPSKEWKDRIVRVEQDISKNNIRSNNMPLRADLGLHRNESTFDVTKTKLTSSYETADTQRQTQPDVCYTRPKKRN